MKYKLKKKIKNAAKNALGSVNAWINGVKIGKNVYIGRHFKCNVGSVTKY